MALNQKKPELPTELKSTVVHSILNEKQSLSDVPVHPKGDADI